MKYAVGIPTRDRPEMSAKVVQAFRAQTVPPASVIVVDNGMEQYAPEDVGDDYIEGSPVGGPEDGHQAALLRVLQISMEQNILVMVRWDDDLVPERDCMERMLQHFEAGFRGAVGGCYPRPGPWPVWERKQEPPGPCWERARIPPDGHKGHEQFFRWTYGGQSCATTENTRHLYSGMMYWIPRAVEVGGFCTEYSQAGYRGETDFSLRMGDCRIQPTAIAVHHYCKTGGIRSIPATEYGAMVEHDEALFQRRMAERGIDISGGYWK